MATGEVGVLLSDDRIGLGSRSYGQLARCSTRRPIMSSPRAAQPSPGEAPIRPARICGIDLAPVLAANAIDLRQEAEDGDFAKGREGQRRRSLSIRFLCHRRTPNVRPVTPPGDTIAVLGRESIQLAVMSAPSSAFALPNQGSDNFLPGIYGTPSIVNLPV